MSNSARFEGLGRGRVASDDDAGRRHSRLQLLTDGGFPLDLAPIILRGPGYEHETRSIPELRHSRRKRFLLFLTQALDVRGDDDAPLGKHGYAARRRQDAGWPALIGHGDSADVDVLAVEVGGRRVEERRDQLLDAFLLESVVATGEEIDKSGRLWEAGRRQLCVIEFHKVGGNAGAAASTIWQGLLVLALVDAGSV